VNFGLAQYHKWSLTEIEDMIPFERDLYVDMLRDYLEKEQERLKANNRG
jgi:hypothetical protein